MADSRPLGTVIIAAGAVALVYCLFTYSTNQPVHFDPTRSQPSIFGGRDDLGNLLAVQTENLQRSMRRRLAAAGAAVSLFVLAVGVGVYRFAHPSTQTISTLKKEPPT